MNIGNVESIDPNEGVSSIVIGNVPDGAVFNAGNDNGNGTWTIPLADLDGLTITPAPHDSEDFTLTTGVTFSEQINNTYERDVTVENVNGQNVFYVDGIETPILNFERGSTYVFEQSDDSNVNHPFYIGNADGTEYTDGVSFIGTPGTDGAKIVFQVPMDAPNDLIYYCQVHGQSMGNVGNVIDASVSGEDYTGTVDVVVHAVIDDMNVMGTVGNGTVDVKAESDIGTTMNLNSDGDFQFLVYSADITPPGSFLGFTFGTTETYTLGAFDTTTASVTDNDITLHDNATTAGGVTDDNGEQILGAAITIGGVTYAAGTAISATSRADIVNNTTGESGSIYTVQIGGSASAVVFASDIAISQGDNVSWTTSNDTSVQNPTYQVGQVDFASLVGAAGGIDEDDALTVELGAVLRDLDGSETVTGFSITGVPTGATLSAGTNNGGGSWTLAPAQISGLTMSLVTHDDTDFTLNITATNQEEDPNTGVVTTDSTSVSLDVTVNAVADEVVITAADTSGDQNTPIALNISASLIDLDGSESMNSVVISGVPTNAVMSAGTDNGDGSYTLTPSQLNGLTVTPGDDLDFTLTITVDNSDTDTETGEVDTNQTVATMDITVNTVTVDSPVDATVLSSQVSGNEDGTIALNLGPIAAIDGTETIGDLLIGNVPEGTSFSAGTDNGDGTWTIPLADVKLA